MLSNFGRRNSGQKTKQRLKLRQTDTFGWSAAVQFCRKTKRWTRLWTRRHQFDPSVRPQTTLWICPSTFNQISSDIWPLIYICPFTVNQIFSDIFAALSLFRQASNRWLKLSQTFKSCLIIYDHAISPISHRLTGIQLLSFISKFVKPLNVFAGHE